MSSKIQRALAEVRELNANINGGRGTGVLRSVIFHLERGDWDSACNVTSTDADKLWQYDGAREKVEEIGLIETFDMPWLDS